MRRLLLVPLFVLACTAKEEAAPAAEEAMAPAGLTADQVAGNWSGKTTAEASDSVLSEWTATTNADGSGVLRMAGDTTGVAYTTVFAGDSMMAASARFVDAASGQTVSWTSVGRLGADGTLSGTTATADTLGTVLSRGRWTASRAAQ